MAKAVKVPSAVPEMPTLEEFLSYAVRLRYDPRLAKRCWRFYVIRKWHFPDGDPIELEH